MKHSEKNLMPRSESRHFLFGCDPNMVEPLVVAWAGIWQHMRKQELVFHLRAIDVAPRQIERFKVWCGKRSIMLRVYDHSGIAMQGSGTLAYPESSTVRLVPLQELHEVGERLVYLDADLIVLADLNPLFEISLSGNPCAACVDPVVARAPRNEALGLPSDAAYFNAGVMVIDVAAWSEARISERAMQFLQQHPDLCKFSDQDALNATIGGNYVLLDSRYNTFALLEDSTRDWGMGRVAVVHFAMYPKPWDLKQLKSGDLERAAYFWSQACLGLRPGRARLVALWLKLRNRFRRAAGRGLAALSRWRCRLTPPWLEAQYCRVRFVLSRGKWR
jgi:lipopolysaccharide biosynthesis glycosyltransferase